MNIHFNHIMLKQRTVWFLITLFFLISLVSCSLWNPAPSNGQEIPLNGSSPTQTGGPALMTDTPTQVPFSLSEGKPQPAATATSVPAKSEPLTDDEVTQILNRLPTLAVNPADQTSFKLPQDPIPPPLKGETKNEPFPPESIATPPQPRPPVRWRCCVMRPKGKLQSRLLSA